jgi:hypothetical protein
VRRVTVTSTDEIHDRNDLAASNTPDNATKSAAGTSTDAMACTARNARASASSPPAGVLPVTMTRTLPDGCTDNKHMFVLF